MAIPFAFLATVLLFMDQQITALIVNRKDHKLKVLVLCLEYPVKQGRDAFALVYILMVWPAQPGCLGGSAGRALAQ